MSLRKTVTGVAAALAMSASVSANAAFITNVEAGLDLVFSQASFGATPIDIVWGTAAELVAPSLLDITAPGEVTSLFSNHATFGAANQAVFYFIDTMSACGATINPAIVGCGELPGNDFVVESSFAGGGFGVELLAHELGHNLGLPHLAGATTLMNPFLNGGTDLNASEVATIFSSPLVQGNSSSGFFIDIIPVLVVATATNPVDEPPLVALMLIGVGFVAARRVRRRAA